MDDDKATAVMALRLIAAKAQKTANDLEKGRLWEGDLVAALDDIRRQLADAGRPAGRGC